MAEIINIKNEAGEVQYPVTKPECVIDENGKNVLQLIRENGSSSSYDDTELRERIEENEILIEDLRENKADKDGVYSGMTVGRSIDLLGVEDVEEGSFLFRPTDGDGSIKDGVAVVKSVKGNSVVWNQLYDRKPLTISGMTITIDGDTTIINGEAQARYFPIKMNVRIPEHKILMVAECVSNSDGLSFNVSDLNSDAKGIDITQSVTFGYCIYTGTHRAAGNSIGLQSFGGVGTAFNNVKIVVSLYDLTQMFGASNEPSTIEEFNARVATLCIEDMNAYNGGEVVNMKASAIKSVGFNAWDEEWEIGKYQTTNGKPVNANVIRCKNAIAVLPNMTYHFNIPIPSSLTDKSHMGYALFYNEDDAYINYAPVGGTYYTQCLTPADARYMRFYLRAEYGATYKNDICINLVHSGYRNGEYEPYVEDVLALPTLDLFPNGMNKIGDVYDEYDSDKSVQRIGIRPYQSGDESIENVLTDGTTTIYVLEEPIVTPHDYRLAYKAWDFGTEQVIADGNTTAITAGITYEFNARDTIRGNKTRLDVLEPIVAGKIDKAADDYYPQLAVGLADNLAGVDVVDSEINFRRSGGGAISDGVARIESIKGNSVVWNQLYPTGWSVTREGITITSQNNIITANGTLTTTYFGHERFVENEVNHKYLFIVEGLSSALNGAIFSLQNRLGNEATVSNGFAYFFHDNSDPSLGRNIGFSRLTSGTVISETYILRQIDLTQMFGAGNEPTTIEDFYARIPMGIDLNAYNEGEVIHMDVQSVESQGVNQWGGQLEEGKLSSNGGEPTTGEGMARSKEFMRVLPSTSYFEKHDKINGTNVFFYPSFYDSEYNFISHLTSLNNQVFNTPSNAVYMRFYLYCSAQTIPLDYDICINISDASINGKYFPYIKRAEDLSIIRKYFPQGMKSAGSAHDEIRYNKVTQKWEYSKGRFRSVDLGTLNWKNLDASNGMFYLSKQEVLDLNMATHDNENIPTNLISSLYASAPTYDIVNIDKVFRGPFTTKFSGYLTVKDTSYTDAASFKAMLQEKQVVLYYESNDWEWEELDAEDQFRDLDYQVWNCGTEKAIAEGKSAPLAADITYGFNAIGKIKELESLVSALRAKVGI